MARYIQTGENIEYKNTGSTAIIYGDVVVLNKTIAVANCDIQVGAIGTVSLTGVYEMKANSTALVVGEALYWDVANSELTKVATGGIVAGLCIEEKASTILTAKVRL